MLPSMATGDVWMTWNTAFWGGATDGVSGAVGYDFRSHNLTAQLAFFFFDDAIVALGANVSDARASALVWTTLAARLVPPATAAMGALTVATVGGGAPAVLPDGNYSFSTGPEGPPGTVNWLWIGGLGIIPAVAVASGNSTSSPINVSVGARTAPWSDIGPYPGSSSGRLFEAILDHGRSVEVRMRLPATP